MQEFCPVCMKNGIQVQIKCYQVDLEEAIFMCPTEKCPWPFESQDPIKVKRPILPSGNKDWHKIPQRYLKENKIFQNNYSDFTLCTPPQTPSSNADINDVQNTDFTTVPEVTDGTIQSIIVDCNGEQKPVEFAINYSNSFDNFDQTSINDVFSESQQSMLTNSVNEKFPVENGTSAFPVKSGVTVSNVSREKSSISQSNIQPVVIKKNLPKIIKNESAPKIVYIKKTTSENGPILVLNKENCINNQLKTKKLRVRPSFSSFHAPITKFNFDDIKSTKKEETVKTNGCDVNDNKGYQIKKNLPPQAVDVPKISPNMIVNNSSVNEGKDALLQLDAKINELNNGVTESNKLDINDINFDDLFNDDDFNFKDESKETLNLENNCTDVNINCNVFNFNDTNTETNRMEVDNSDFYLSSFTF